MINYHIIADANTYYPNLGYIPIEVPWTVTKEISDITKPIDKKDFALIHENNKVLVASAEQSFLYQYSKGFLPKGKFMSTSPCFRFENYDSWHHKQFIKTEIIITDVVSENMLKKLITQAFKFFSRHLPQEYLSKVQTSNSSWDINFNNIELGSYGFRSCNFLNWIYGTGVAEPRLSLTINNFKLHGLS